ncbi:MAG: MBL fold metallo-hydrolase [Actinomycetota bacterium]
MRLTVVGCSGSFPGPESPASSYLVTADDDAGRTWRVVLDLGNGALGPLQRHARLVDVDAVLVSHLHPDHFLDLCGFYVALKYDPDGEAPGRLPVWGPPGTSARLAEAYGRPEGSGMGAQLDVRVWADGEPVRVGPFTVTPRRVLHPVEAYGVRVEAPGADGGRRVLAYTGDTDDCPALDELAADADLLLAEAAFHEGRDEVRGIHLTGRRAGEVATRARARRLVLTHLPPWNDADRALAEARQTYAGPIELARPDAVLDV